MTGRVADWNRQSMKKDGSKPQHGVRQMGSLFHSQAPLMMADGGLVDSGGNAVRDSSGSAVRTGSSGDADEARFKQRGLDASKGEKVGFFERMRAGNIDEPGSEAYKRFGAGRGRMEAELDSAIQEADEVKAKSAAPAPARMMSVDVDERDRRIESAANYKPVEITPVRAPQRIESRPIAATPVAREASAQERRSAVRMGDVRKPSRQELLQMSRAKDKKTFGAINRTESNRAQREQAMRDDKKTY